MLFCHGFDLGRLYAVAVDLDHIVLSSENHKISVRETFCQVTCAEESILQRFFRLLRKSYIATEERHFHTELPGFTIRYFHAVLIDYPDPDSLIWRFPRRAYLISFFKEKMCNCKEAFTHSVYINKSDLFQEDSICRFTSCENHFYTRWNVSLQCTYQRW